MKIPRLFAYILLVVFGCVLLVLLGGNQVNNNCRARDTIEAVAPVYPGSTLARKETMFDSDIGVERWYTYTVSASPEAVSTFYAEALGSQFDKKMFDDNEIKNQIYFGDAKPFGKYTVLIGKHISPTTYSISIRWDRCGPIHKSVE